MQELKKFRSSICRDKKVQFLTLTSSSWSRSNTASFFGTSQHFVNLARETKKGQVILGKSPQIHRHGLSPEAVKNVKQFYQRDGISRMCPNKKNYVTVRNGEGTAEKVQKRLLLCNARKAYLLSKKELPNDKVGFSPFSELRPKWCITVGKTGSHVCVCMCHQNLKLMLSVVDSIGTTKI